MHLVKPPVLYVEDEEDDAFIMQLAWQRAKIDHPLVVLADGQQVLDYIAGVGRFSDRGSFPIPGLILLDLNLPRISGLEVLKTLRERYDKNILPIVLFSSSDSPKDKLATTEAGANVYIVKPTGISALVQTIQSIAPLITSCAG